MCVLAVCIIRTHMYTDGCRSVDRCLYCTSIWRPHMVLGLLSTSHVTAAGLDYEKVKTLSLQAAL